CGADGMSFVVDPTAGDHQPARLEGLNPPLTSIAEATTWVPLPLSVAAVLFVEFTAMAPGSVRVAPPLMVRAPRVLPGFSTIRLGGWVPVLARATGCALIGMLPETKMALK